MRKNKDFSRYKYLIRLAFPIMIQNLFSAAISSTDVLMLNSVGQSAISAASLAIQYSSVLLMILYGIGTGANILCSQYWGKKDLDSIAVVEGISLRLSLFTAILFASGALFFPEGMMRIFTNDTELIALGASYLKIAGIGFLFWAVAETYLSALRSVERVTISTALNVSALLLNVLLNAVFIYGFFGAPKMGVRGVALATTISRGYEMAACFVVSACSKDVKLKVSYLFLRSRVLLRDFVRLALPALANDISWSLAFTMYSVVMGHLGTDLVAAYSLVVVVRNFGTVLCYGIASACGIAVGKELGAGKLEKAEETAADSMFLTITSGAIGGGIVLLLTPFVLRFTSLTDVAHGYLRIMLFLNAFYIMGTAVNSTLIAGVFRAGGDTRFGLICDTIDMWGYGVPIAFLSAFVLKLPPMIVYFLMCTDEFVKWPWVLGHYRSKSWLKNITREQMELK